MNAPRAVVALAAGKTARIRSDQSEVLHPISGRPLIGHLLETVKVLTPDRLVVMALMATALPSVITEDVESDAMAFGRARQVAKPGRARAFRAARVAAKESKKD